MKSLLITGGSGLLGLNWAFKLKKKYNIHLAINKTVPSYKEFDYLKLNLINYKDLLKKIKEIKPSIIIHTAGLTDVDKCEKLKKKCFKSNVTTTNNLSKISNLLNIKFVFISTDHLFEGIKSFNTEKSKTFPLNYYAKTKLIAENIIKKNTKDYLILRSNFFAWGPHYRKSFAETILEDLTLNKNQFLFKDVIFNPVYCGTLIDIAHKLLNKNFFGTFNVATNDNISKFEFGLQISKNFGFSNKHIDSISINDFKKLVRRTKNMSLSNKKISKTLNINIGNIKSEILKFKKDINTKSFLKNYLPYGKHHIDNEDIKSVVQTLKGPFLTQGKTIEKFENEIAEYVGAKYAVAVSSCTAGLHIAYKAAGVNDKNQIITSPITFVSTPNASLYEGSSFQISDIDSQTLNICPDILKKNLKRFNTIKVIAPVHFGGLPCDISNIKKIIKNKNIVIVEDAAHALGAKYKNGKMVGSCYASLMTVFSFHPVKIIASGEGGVVTTNDPSIYKQLLRLRSHGVNKNTDILENKKYAYDKDNKKNIWYYEMQELGYNYRLTDIQASLGISQLNKIDLFINKRKKLVGRYLKKFSSFNNCRPAQDTIIENSAHHLFILQIDFKKIGKSRNILMKQLQQLYIITQVHYIPLPVHPYYRKFNFKKKE